MEFSNWKLTLRLWVAMALLFGLLYGLLILAGSFVKLGGFTLYAFLGISIIILQFFIGPKIVEVSMKVKYVSEEESSHLHQIISDLAMTAGIPKPKVGISEISVPNAFAFGKTKKDGRICVTRGLLGILDDDEIKAVLGHELAHIKHNDMAVTTLISAIPLICYYLSFSFMFSGDDRGSGGFIIGILALLAYLIGQLIVLFISRTREYYADQGSVEMGGQPDKLASALYKLVYGSATANKEEIKNIQGIKAFFLNDVSVASDEINELSELDIDKDGKISASELSQLKYKKINLKTSDKLMEIFSTHPNMLKRIEKLSEYS